MNNLAQHVGAPEWQSAALAGSMLRWVVSVKTLSDTENTPSGFIATSDAFLPLATVACHAATLPALERALKARLITLWQETFTTGVVPPLPTIVFAFQ